NETQTKRISVIPVRGEPCEIPDFLAQRSYADISGGIYPLGLRHLLEILHYYSGEANSDALESTTLEEDESSLRWLSVVTPIAIEVSNDLISIFEPASNGANSLFDELLPGMREALQGELGIPFPRIRVRGNETDMPPCSALIMVDEVPEAMFVMGQDNVLVD